MSANIAKIAKVTRIFLANKGLKIISKKVKEK